LPEVGVLIVALVFGGLNLRSYVKDETRIWGIDYMAENELIAQYINENYRDSVLAVSDYPVRGYINLLFGRGVYEYTNVDTAREKAVISGKQYVVMLEPQEYGEGVIVLKVARIYDIQKNSVQFLSVENGKVSIDDAADSN